MSTSITPQGYMVLDEVFPQGCSDLVRAQGRLDLDPFGSIDFCRPYWMSGTAVIDVGANIGCWSSAMVRAVGPGGTLLAFEGDPETARCLKYNLREFPNARCRNAAVWDSDGFVPFLVNHGNRDCGSVFYTGVPFQSHQDSVRVEAIRLDSLIPYPSYVSFIKVDVEGAELHVLKGSEKLIENDHPILFLESLEHAQNTYGNTLNEMIDWIRSRGYTIKPLNDYHDILCLPS
jgi:FkbM family methyltransferase